MADKGGRPMGKGGSLLDPAQLEKRMESLNRVCTRERWVLVPRKCLVQELFIRRLSSKISPPKVGSQFSTKFPPISPAILILSSPAAFSKVATGNSLRWWNYGVQSGLLVDD